MEVSNLRLFTCPKCKKLNGYEVDNSNYIIYFKRYLNAWGHRYKDYDDEYTCIHCGNTDKIENYAKYIKFECPVCERRCVEFNIEDIGVSDIRCDNCSCCVYVYRDECSDMDESDVFIELVKSWEYMCSCKE